MWIECPQAAVVSLALLYWAASLAILILRLVRPDFQQLAAYGGHGAASASAAPQQATKTAKDKASTKCERSAKKKPARKGLLATAMALVQRSPLGVVRVTRQQSFTAFYLTGVATSVLLLRALYFSAIRRPNAPPEYYRDAFVTAVPSLLFTLHCAIRLAETRWIQRFRSDDSVTLFAAVAGSTFYAAAAVSSAVPASVTATAPARLLPHAPVMQCCFVVGAVVHLVVQGVQVMTHTILARLRQPQSAPLPGEKEVWCCVQSVLTFSASTVPATSEKRDEVVPALRGPWSSYHFPYQVGPIFQTVLDPHYTCEIFLYLVNTMLIVLCSLPYAPLQVMTGGKPKLSFLSGDCTGIEWVSMLAGGGVTLFTLFNLSITAGEHRRFWKNSNATRREVAAALALLLSADETSGMPQLPAELITTASRIKEEMTLETLPRWNVVPFVW